MLVSFNVKNFRSIDLNGINFSMLPSKGATRTLSTGSFHIPEVMKIGAIYGPNGAGKSNIVTAMIAMISLVQTSGSNNSNSVLPHEPFLLCENTLEKPTHFEVQFLFDEKIWRYGFTYDAQRFHEEWLYARNSKARSIERVLFFRRNELRTFGQDMRPHKKFLEDRTTQNQLYLSKLDQNNASETQAAFDWLTNYFRPIGHIDDLGHIVSARKIGQSSYKENIVNFLKSTGVQVEDIIVTKEERKIDEKESLAGFLRGNRPTLSVTDNIATRYDIKFTHKNRQNVKIEFELDDESTGTQNLFSLAGPLIDTLKNGYTLVCDEINQTFHTDALLAIIDIFVSEEANQSDAQLIFTSHDVSVMDHLERDEIWFAEKDISGATELYSLSDIGTVREGGARRNEAFGKRYLEGRYGAKPFINVAEAIRKIRLN